MDLTCKEGPLARQRAGSVYSILMLRKGYRVETDLFGNVVRKEQKSLEETYSEYIASAAWKRKREAAIERAGKRCEWCGASKWVRQLEVHHKTYERLGHEEMSDLVVLCRQCHAKADELRRLKFLLRSRLRAMKGPLYKGFDAWMVKSDGEHWQDTASRRKIQQQKRHFLWYILRTTGYSYKLNLSRVGFPDLEPDWKPEED